MQCHMHLLYHIFPLSSSWLMYPGLYFLHKRLIVGQTLAAPKKKSTHPVETPISTLVLQVLTFV